MRNAPSLDRIRPPAVAGTFYPDRPAALRAAVESYLAAARPARLQGMPKALIAPHAGFVYSGPTAGHAFATLAGAGGRIGRVVVIGPAHYVRVRGIAVPTAAAFRTPLGEVPVDREAVVALAALPQVALDDGPHRPEHALEVELPFLQIALGDFALVPLVVGDADPAEIAAVLGRLWGGDETLIVVSSDLSHYHTYETARRLDAATAAAIEACDGSGLGRGNACGFLPIAGLLAEARRRADLAVRRLDLRNSGDTAGPRDRVVGYGAWAFGDRAAMRSFA